ncbi:hypothetical protein E4T50_00560 [Aureobasidium sp. EXF-12298]|nr:hypothetical protein E4T50_00560 [Aureobasidium sp. EXF-12298]KAI4766807.1 hypothetical protein E4T51_00247 [Aureobasidium sp. EXF-12344]KAI4784310.1 hypothetical protein E4T52_00757 [Aureobasidium sp. EXF-3400]
MAQGTVKQKVKTEPKKGARPTGPQTGNRVIKPKRAAMLKQENLKKKHSAGLITLTERSLAEKAGHLEMLKGGKKDRLEKAKNKAFNGGNKKK